MGADPGRTARYATGAKGIWCSKENICYKIECQVRREQELLILYIGYTSRSGRERIADHQWLFRDRKEGCEEYCKK